LKKCYRCKIDKPFDAFSKNVNRKSGATTYCKLCSTIISREYRQHNPEKMREYESRPEVVRRKQDWHLRRKYGISIELFDKLFEIQGRCCGICHTTSSGGTGGWHTDHDHSTGKIRGILCAQCNLLIGMARENPELLVLIAHYLVRNQDRKWDDSFWLNQPVIQDCEVLAGCA